MNIDKDFDILDHESHCNVLIVNDPTIKNCTCSVVEIQNLQAENTRLREIIKTWFNKKTKQNKG